MKNNPAALNVTEFHQTHQIVTKAYDQLPGSDQSKDPIIQLFYCAYRRIKEHRPLLNRSAK